MEVVKVKCFYVVIFGYLLMIFSLDDKCCLKIFLEKCEFVWKELVFDFNFLDKLVSI